jgi:hypothetical protein
MTQKPADVRLARHGDEELLFALACESDEEWSLGPRDDNKVRDVIGMATMGGPPPRPVFGVVVGPSILEGAIGLFPTEPWNSNEPYIRAFFHYVSPLYRKSTHAVHLAQFAKWFGELSGMPVIFEVLHPERTEAKMRLYGRQATPIGGLFIHGAPTVRKAAAA